MTAVSDLVLSLRAQIPDPVEGEDPNLDGRAFPTSTLLRWINDAGRLICLAAPVLQDWYGLQSLAGQDVYPLPSYITSVEQVWYDSLPLGRSPEWDGLYSTKATGRAWWFGPHALHASPRLHLFPAPDRTGASTTLASSITDTATSLTVASATGFRPYGFAWLGGTELVRYATLSGTTLSNLLRGQGGTRAAAWTTGTSVVEGNVFFKCFRLPVPVTRVDDTLELPEPLWPLVELYVLSKVREAEQDHTTSGQLTQQFFGLVECLADKSQLKGLRQGLQVRIGSGQHMVRGRLFLP